MKNKIILFILIITGAYSSVAQAQVRRVTIIDELETFAPGEGVIKITCDQRIKDLIGSRSSETSADRENTITANGFRIQVFMSSLQTARNEAAEKASLIRRNFPEIKTYENFNSPNWRLLAGDFMTKEEAEVFRQQLQRSLPSLGREMYIIQDKVNIAIHKFY